MRGWQTSTSRFSCAHGKHVDIASWLAMEKPKMLQHANFNPRLPTNQSGIPLCICGESQGGKRPGRHGGRRDEGGAGD